MELQKKIDELGSAFEQFKKSNDEALEQLKKNGAVDPVLKGAVDKANSDIDRICKERDSLVKEIEGIKTAMNRPGFGAPAKTETEEKASHLALQKKAFDKLLRKGEHALSPDEQKLLSVSDDSQGGYLVPREIEKTIIRNLANINVLRQLADVRQISVGNSFEQPRRTAGITATNSSETSSNPSAGNPTYGMLRIVAEEARALLKATPNMLEDPAFDIEAILNDEAVEAFSNLDGSNLMTGNGVGKPRGLMSYPSGTGDGQIEQIASGSAATIPDTDGGANGIVSMVFKLKAAYAKNAAFLLNRATTGSIRKLKDANKNYIWSPGYGQGLGATPPTIMGYPYFEDDNVAVEGASNLVMAFGDFKRAYKVVDKIGIAVTRDPFSSKPNIEWLFRKRTGGAVEIFEAVKLLYCHT